MVSVETISNKKTIWAILFVFSLMGGACKKLAPQSEDASVPAGAAVALTSTSTPPPTPYSGPDPGYNPITYRYLSPNGDDSRSGMAEATAWKTLQYAADHVAAGTLVSVADGTYVGFHFSSDHSGTKEAPIIFRASGSNVIINSRDPNPSRSNNAENNVNIYKTDYIVMDGFIVQNASQGGILVDESKGVIIRNNRVSSCQRWCILTGFAEGVQILNNTVSDAVEHGIYVSNSTGPNDNPVIRGNTAYANGRSGIQVNGDCNTPDSQGKTDGVISGAVIENNVVYGNTAKGMSLISMQDSVVQNNLIYANKDGAAGIHLADEPGCRKSSNRNTVVNNTVVENQIAGIRITDGASGNIIFNNILISTRNVPIMDEVGKAGENQIDAESNLMMFSLPASLFVSPDRSDYHLLSEGQARNRGKVLYEGKSAPGSDFVGTARPQGGQIDMGAYEQ
jgi:parallel beta-helix repeat protein